MKKTIQEIISRSLFCEPSQLETPGRILITDCHWTKNFSDCAQLFEIDSDTCLPFHSNGPPVSAHSGKIRLGSGLNPVTIFKLLRDRKTFHDLENRTIAGCFF